MRISCALLEVFLVFLFNRLPCIFTFSVVNIPVVSHIIYVTSSVVNIARQCDVYLVPIYSNITVLRRYHSRSISSFICVESDILSSSFRGNI